ncbi:hypothetical protein [Pseudorhodoplanes sp.]|uniref:hypothetical protein n=1 Tax=Pseudorhodoplanes sp. TaxID=1934341 RepID=UPI00391ABD79
MAKLCTISGIRVRWQTVMNAEGHVTMGEEMPRFAANIAYLFSDRPLIERPRAAAAAGFAAV